MSVMNYPARPTRHLLYEPKININLVDFNKYLITLNIVCMRQIIHSFGFDWLQHLLKAASFNTKMLSIYMSSDKVIIKVIIWL